MTTSTYTTTWAHSSNATFQAWGSALSAAIQACGCLPTSDTGQINWSTVAMPGVNTSAGYEIYALTDSLQSTSPIFIKLEYGTGPIAGYPMLWVTVGSATNGTGNLTGVTTTRENIITNYNAVGSITSGAVAYPTYVCFDGSYLGFSHKIASLTIYTGIVVSAGSLIVGRQSNPATGAYIAGGVTCLTPATGVDANTAPWVSQSLNTVTNINTIVTTGYFAMVPFSMTNTSVAALGEYQIFPCFGVYPQAIPLAFAAYGLNSETPQGSTVNATIVGSTPVAYLMTGAASYGAGIPSTNAYSLLMKYQ